MDLTYSQQTLIDVIGCTIDEACILADLDDRYCVIDWSEADDNDIINGVAILRDYIA